MRKLFGRFVVVIAKAGGVSQLRDVFRVACQKVPAVGGVRAHLLRQVIDINFFLLGCEFACLARVEADCDDVKLFTDLKRQYTKRRHHSVEYLRAKHRTVVIDERQDDGLMSEVLAEFYLLPAFVTEDEIERQLLIEFLFDTYVTQCSRQTG